MTRLWRTSAIRLALRYALYYALIAGAGLGALYWATSQYVNAQLATSLSQQLDGYRQIAKQKGVAGLIAQFNQEQALDNRRERYVLLVDAAGRYLAGDLTDWPAGLSADDQVRNIWLEDDLLRQQQEDGPEGHWPTVATRLAGGERLLATQSIGETEALQAFILSAVIITLGMIVTLTLVLGWNLGRQMLARVDRVNRTTARIIDGRLDQRIPISERNDEFDDLARNLNRMLDHIDKLVAGMRQVTDNVAHDLRRPLTRVRNRLDVTLLEARDPAQYVATLDETRADIEQIIATFNTLLDIAQTESGHIRGSMADMDLSALAQELGEVYEDAFTDNGQQLVLAITPDQHVTGNRDLLGQTISNLLENALKYAGSQATVTLTVAATPQSVQLSVCDTGPGIPAEQRDRVLERFVRLDDARSTAGNGLGLSLVAASARLHGATLRLTDNGPGLCVGLGFTMTTSGR